MKNETRLTPLIFKTNQTSGRDFLHENRDDAVLNAYERIETSRRVVPQFTRHRALPPSAFAGVFQFASRLGTSYWTAPIQEDALDRVWAGN